MFSIVSKERDFLGKSFLFIMRLIRLLYLWSSFPEDLGMKKTRLLVQFLIHDLMLQFTIGIKYILLLEKYNMYIYECFLRNHTNIPKHHKLFGIKHLVADSSHCKILDRKYDSDVCDELP